MHHRRRLSVSAALGLAVATLLTACGGGDRGFFSSETRPVEAAQRQLIAAQALPDSPEHSQVIQKLTTAGFQVFRIEVPKKGENKDWFADFRCVEAPAPHTCKDAPSVVLSLAGDPKQGTLTVGITGGVWAYTDKSYCQWRGLDPKTLFPADWIWYDIDEFVKENYQPGTGGTKQFEQHRLFCYNRRS